MIRNRRAHYFFHSNVASWLLSYVYFFLNLHFATFIWNWLVYHFLIETVELASASFKSGKLATILIKKCHFVTFIRNFLLTTFDSKLWSSLLFHSKLASSLLFVQKCRLWHFHSKLSTLPLFDPKLTKMAIVPLFFFKNDSFTSWFRNYRTRYFCIRKWLSRYYFIQKSQLYHFHLKLSATEFATFLFKTFKLAIVSF